MYKDFLYDWLENFFQSWKKFRLKSLYTAFKRNLTAIYCKSTYGRCTHTLKSVHTHACHVCNDSFDTEKGLKQHQTINKHGNASASKYICKFCNKTYTCSNNMYRHVKHNHSIDEDNNRYNQTLYTQNKVCIGSK